MFVLAFLNSPHGITNCNHKLLTVSQGYMDSLPEPNLRLEKEVAQSKKKVVDLKGQVEEVKQALAEAKAQLQERAENQKVVNAAKATAAELVVSARRGGGGRENVRNVLCVRANTCRRRTAAGVIGRSAKTQLGDETRLE